LEFWDTKRKNNKVVEVSCEDVELIEGFVYGNRIPTNVDLCMQGNSYIALIAITSIICGLVFWMGWNANT